MSTKILEHSLANGLKIIGEHNPHHVSSALGFFVRTGARDETPAEAGVSHFLEHMMFKGTASRSALDITYQMGNIGAQSNAFTSEENTVYYASVIPEYFETIQDILSDMLRPALDENEFNTEKKVILEEIALYQDRPHFYLFEHAMSDYFGAHPAGNSVLGSTSSVGALTRAQMKDYFDRRYAPSNICLVASGQFEWNRFIELAEKYCGNWQTFDVGRDVKTHSPASKDQTYYKSNLNQAHILFMTGGASAQSEARIDLSVLSTILGDSTGSKLYWALVDQGIAESAGTEHDEKDGTGCFMAYAGCEPARVEEVRSKIKAILKSALDFSSEELERAKTKLLTRLVLGGELPMGRMMALGTEWNYRRRIHRLADSMAAYKRVTRDSIIKAVESVPFGIWSEFKLMPKA